MTLILALAVASASPQPDWSAPPGCPDHGQVSALAGELLLTESPAAVEFTGAIRLVDTGYRLELVVAGVRREVASDSCEMLGQAAALIVAVAYDPVAVVSAMDAPVQRPADPSPRPEPLVAASEPTISETPPREGEPVRRPDPPPRLWNRGRSADAPSAGRLGGLVRLSFGAGVGVLPSAGIGFELASGLRGARWRAELGATGWLPRQTRAESNGDFGARTALFGAQARGCYVPTLAAVEFPLCAGLEAGGLWAEGTGPGVRPRSEVQAWVGALASGGVAWWVRRRLGIAARVEVPIGIVRPAVHLQGVGPLFRAGPLGARLFVGPTVRFP